MIVCVQYLKHLNHYRCFVRLKMFVCDLRKLQNKFLRPITKKKQSTFLLIVWLWTERYERDNIFSIHIRFVNRIIKYKWLCSMLMIIFITNTSLSYLSRFLKIMNKFCKKLTNLQIHMCASDNVQLNEIQSLLLRLKKLHILPFSFTIESNTK